MRGGDVRAGVRGCVREVSGAGLSDAQTPRGLLDKRACAAGGAGTHRLNLSDAVLVKDTHLELLHHDFEKVLDGLISARLLGRFVEIEVESLKEARQALQMLLTLQKKHPIPCFIMLDNMKPAEIKKFAEELRAGNADSAGTLHEASNVNWSGTLNVAWNRRSGGAANDASKKSGLVFLEASGGITLKIWVSMRASALTLFPSVR